MTEQSDPPEDEEPQKIRLDKVVLVGSNETDSQLEEHSQF